MHRLFWIIGAVGLPLSHYWLIAKVEPFYSLIYLFLWWSYIFAADFVVFKLRGTSLLSDRRWEFVVIWFWSIPLWLLFEVVNRKIHNWYYIMAPTSLIVGGIYLVFAFGAVLPGIFITVELVVGLIEKYWPGGKIKGPPFVAHRGNLTIQLAVGLGMLLGIVIFPDSCFAFAWGFAFFGIDPLCYWLFRKERNHSGRSLLGQMASGDNTRFVAILVAGLLCGGLWEGWNINARTKWIYSVPYFDELKLFEMPLLGFLGFPPFALECYALINLLTWFRRGRNWELADAENKQFPGVRGKTVFMVSLLLPLFLAWSSYLTLRNVASFAEPIDWHFRTELGPGGRQALREHNAVQGHEFLKLKERPAEIAEPLWERLQKIVPISELKGMGLRNALLLEKLQITDFHQLARQDPDVLALKLKELGHPIRPEETKVWIRAAKRTLR